MNIIHRYYSAHFILISFLLLLVPANSAVAQRSLSGTTPSAMQPGAPAGSYSISEFENVNLYNGNLNFYLPLASVGGRGSVSTTVGLPIEPKWAVGSTEYNGNTIYYPYTLQNYSFASTPFIKTKMRTRYGGDTIIGCRSNPLDPNHTDPYYSQTLTRLSFTDVNGTEYELIDSLTNGAVFNVPRDQNQCPTASGQRGKVFVSKNGSSATFVSDYDISDINEPGLGNNLANPSGYLYLSDGTRYRFEAGTISWIKDRNGNKITFSYSTGNQNYLIYTITDSLNRKIIIQHVLNHPTHGECDSITYDGFGGQSRTVYVTYTNLSNALRSGYTIQTNAQLFPQLVAANNEDFNDKVISSVILPDNRSYNFKYDSYGYLARVETPLGAAIEYDWSAGAAGTEPGGVVDYQFGIYRRVTERRSYANGTTLDDKTTFSRPQTYSPGTGYSNLDYVDVDVKTAGNTRLGKTRHYFYGFATDSFYGSPISYSHPYDGREYKTETFDIDGTTVLKRVINTWMQRSGSTWTSAPTSVSFNDPQIVETTTELLDVSPKLVSKTTSIDPNNPGNIGYDQFNNKTDTWEYDWGQNTAGAFLRRSHTDYVTDSNYTSHTGVHMRGLPLQSWISSDVAGNNKVSLSQLEYDVYSGANHAALYDRTNVAGHDSANYGTTNQKRGNVTKVTSYGNAQAQTESISIYSHYDILGNVVETIDGKGNHTITNYDDNFGAPDGEAKTNSAPTQLNGQNAFASPKSSTNALGWITGYSQVDYFTGKPVDIEDLNGVVSSTFYNDSLDRPTQTITANNLSAFKKQTNIIYDDANRRIETKSDLKAFNDNLLKSESFYDGLGRTIKTHEYESDGNFIVTQSVPFLMMQDPENSIWRKGTKVSNPYRPHLNEQPIWTTSLNDSLGRGIKVITPDGAFVKTEYSGNTVTATDQAGKKRRSVTNALGLLKEVHEPNNAGQLGSLGSPNQLTSYTYDALGNLITVQQIGTNAEQCGGTTTSCTQNRSFVYDSLSRLKSANNPESGLIQYTYDNNNNLLTKTDARTITTTYTYDALNRVTFRDYSDSTYDVIYTYDNLLNAKGRLLKVVNGLSSNGVIANPFSITEYQQFDQMGRVTQSQQTTDGAAYPQMTYTYNLSGTLIEQKYPSGRVVKNVLDNDGDLSIVQSKKNQTAGVWNYGDSFTYTAAGAVSSMQFGNGRWESTQFNSRLQPTQIALGTLQNGTDKLKLNFVYNTTGQNDNNGNVLNQTITVPTEVRGTTTHNGFTATQTYTYDSLNRIKQATETVSGQSGNNWQQTFEYDRFGNRKFNEANTTASLNFPKLCGGAMCAADKKIFNPQAQTADNRFSTSDGYQYDLAGNMTGDAKSRRFTYDAENRQTKVETVDSNGNVTGTIGEYFYDGDGKRVKKYVPGTGETTVFIYDATGKLVAENSTLPSPTQTVSYLIKDPLESPRINTDQYGNVTARHDYQPFGEEITRASYGADTNRKQFTGYERDNEIDLDFAQARMYANKLGRFTSVDSAGPDLQNPQTLNKYQYCLNNPLRYIDKTGKYEEDVHRDLTDLLAYAAGFSASQSTRIANANQGVDDNPFTNPFRSAKVREDYHFTSQERRNTLWSAFENNSTFRANENAALDSLGVFFHAQQDSFSHEGYGIAIGHITGGHDVDKTYNDPAKAEKMAKDTYDKLVAARNIMARNDGTLYRPVSYNAIKGLIGKWVRESDPKKKQELAQQIRQKIQNGRDIQTDDSTPKKNMKMKSRRERTEKEKEEEE